MATIKMNTTAAKVLGYGIRLAIPTVYVKVYKGTAPVDADTYVSDPTAYNADLLATIGTIDLVWSSNVSRIEPGTGTFTANTTGAGTAAWAAMYNSVSGSYVVITDVGLVGSTAPITLSGSSLSYTLGSPMTIADIGLQFSY